LFVLSAIDHTPDLAFVIPLVPILPRVPAGCILAAIVAFALIGGEVFKVLPDLLFLELVMIDEGDEYSHAFLLDIMIIAYKLP
jgi:hypothetical protein